MTETPLWPELQTPAPPPSPRRGRGARQLRKRLTIGVVAGVVSLMVVAGGAFALGLFEQGTGVTAAPSTVVPTDAAESAELREGLVAEIASARTVLKGPDGKAAAKAERQALIAAIDDAQQVVTALGSAAVPPSGSEAGAAASLGATGSAGDDVPAVTAALSNAVKAVVASGQQARLERASSGLDTARADLRDAVAAGEETYAGAAVTTGPAGRDALRAALDSAGDAEAEADDVLTALASTLSAPDTTHPAKTVTELLGRAARVASTVSDATGLVQDATATLLAVADQAAGNEGDATDPATGDTDTDPATSAQTTDDADANDTTTAPAGTCPEADQVWSAENGHLSWSELAEIPFAPGHYVRADVVGELAALNDAYVDQFGVNMTINSSYRTYAQQEALYDPSSDTAAPPGCSNHGTGLAIDIGGGVQTFGSAQYDWLKASAEAYGWVHPPFAEPSGRNPEPWHWQSVQAPNSY